MRAHPALLQRMPLQPRDLDRLAILLVQHAGPFAQHLHRTHARTTEPGGCCIQNRPSRAAQIAARYLYDEPWHVDIGRTRPRARSVEAVEAAIRLGDSGGPSKGGSAALETAADCAEWASWLHQGLDEVGPAVAKELPRLAYLGDHVEIEVGDQHFIGVVRAEPTPL